MNGLKQKTLIACVTAVGLIGLFSASQTLAFERNTSIHKLSLDDFIHSGLKSPVGQSREEIISAFGSPKSSRVKLVENKYYPGRMDKIYTLSYDGLTVMIYESSVTKQQFIVSMIIEKPIYKTRNGLDVGAEKSVVLAMFGAPKRMTSRQLVYYDREHGSSSVSFSLSDNKVKEIRWDYHFE